MLPEVGSHQDTNAETRDYHAAMAKTRAVYQDQEGQCCKYFVLNRFATDLWSLYTALCNASAATCLTGHTSRSREHCVWLVEMWVTMSYRAVQKHAGVSVQVYQLSVVCSSIPCDLTS